MGAMINTALTTATTVGAGGTIPFGTNIHGFGRAIQRSGETIQFNESGYYYISASYTVVPTGDETVTMLLNGTAIPGMTASADVTTSGDVVNLSISGVVYISKSCPVITNAITAQLTAGSSVTNANVVAYKLPRC